MADFDPRDPIRNDKSDIKKRIIQELDKKFREGEPTAEDWERLYRQFPNQEGLLDAERKARFKVYKEIREKAQKLARRVFDKYQAGSMTTHRIMEKMKEHKARNNWTDEQFEAFKREFIAILSGHRAKDIENNQHRKAYRSRINQALGGPSMPKIEYSESGLKIKENEHGAVSEIIKLMESNAALANNVYYQSLRYKDMFLPAITGKFDKNKDDPTNYIHPVIACLFLPKIDVLETHFLYSNFGKIVKRKFDKQPINDVANILLLHDITTDPNDVVCDATSPMVDLLNRYKVQIALWNVVISLRSGRYYNVPAMKELTKYISICRNNLFDNADMSFNHDDGSFLRRLFSVFSFRPTFVAVQKLANVITMQQMFQPQGQRFQQDFTIPSGVAYGYTARPAPTLTEIAMINIQLPPPTPTVELGLLAPAAGGGSSMSGGAIPVDLQTHQTLWIYESDTKQSVPKEQSVIGSNGILVFHVNRQAPVVNIQGHVNPFAFNQLPLTTGATLQTFNKHEVNVAPVISIGPSNDIFTLKSVVAVTDTNISTGGLTKSIITGSIGLLIDNDLDGVASGTRYLRYDPFGASQPVLVPPSATSTTSGYVLNDPISAMPSHFSADKTPSWFDTAQKNGTIYIYVPHKPYTPKMKMTPQLQFGLMF